MRNKKILSVIGFLAMAILLVSNGWAGGPENPPATGTIGGPELWGVMVIDCGAGNILSLRVKRIVDCNVQTQAFMDLTERGVH